MIKPILNYIAKHHPKALTETWLNQTEQGHLYRNRHKEPVTKLDLRGKAKAFIDSLPESGWRTTGSPLPFGLRLTGYDLIQQDREILILVHNDKSDIYGVFEKINENRFPVLLDILTAPVERVSAQTISDIEEKLKGIRNDLSEDPVTTAGIAHALHTVALLNKDVKGLLTEDTKGFASISANTHDLGYDVSMGNSADYACSECGIPLTIDEVILNGSAYLCIHHASQNPNGRRILSDVTLLKLNREEILRSHNK